jgi:O-antigen ligase
MAQDPNIPRYLYQPVHNIYLLLYSETGVLGLASFLLFLFFLAKDFITRTGMEKFYHYSFLLVFLSVLFIGFFDHFLLTIQQGRFVFWLTIAILTDPVLRGINKA